MDAGSKLSLRDATSSALRMGGLELLGQPQRLTSYILDLADNSSREVRLLSRQLDGELLAPLAQATRDECTTAGLLTARSRVEQILVDDRYVSGELAMSAAEGLAGGVADFMNVRLPYAVQAERDPSLPHLVPKAAQPTPVPAQTPVQRPTQPQASPKTTSSTTSSPASTKTKNADYIVPIVIFFLLVAVLIYLLSLWVF